MITPPPPAVPGCGGTARPLSAGCVVADAVACVVAAGGGGELPYGPSAAGASGVPRGLQPAAPLNTSPNNPTTEITIVSRIARSGYCTPKRANDVPSAIRF